MYLRKIRVQRLKLVRDLTLDFTGPDGSIRKWTVIIGRNGTAKTSLVQAIALAAAGGLQVNTLGRTTGHLRDRRSREPLRIDAEFEFSEEQRHPALHPLLKSPFPTSIVLRSQATLAEEETSIRASSSYKHGATKKGDPLDLARARNTWRWFVAGYGVARALPDVGRPVTLDRPSIERMVPLFDPETSLISTRFWSIFGQEGQEKAQRFHQVLEHALTNVASLLPDIMGLELGRRVHRPGELQERDRFTQRVGQRELDIPASALAHGYQSTIAWIADLVGHVLLEADMQIEPEQMEGVVLVDEIDLYLHPDWQATLIPALRATFPKMQFIVTTHSPVVLSGVAPHEIVRLASCGDDGDVVEVVHHPETGDLVPATEVEQGARPDARMMTGSEIYREYFGLEGLTPNPKGDELRRYTTLATDPFRSDDEHREMNALRKTLAEANIADIVKPVRRQKP